MEDAAAGCVSDYWLGLLGAASSGTSGSTQPSGCASGSAFAAAWAISCRRRCFLWHATQIGAIFRFWHAFATLVGSSSPQTWQRVLAPLPVVASAAWHCLVGLAG